MYRMLTSIIKDSNIRFIFKCIRDKNNFWTLHYLNNIPSDTSLFLKDENDEDIFINIVKFGTNEMIKFFIQKFTNYNFDFKDSNGIHMIFYVIKRSHIDLDTFRSILIRSNIDININDEHNGSLLYQAVLNRNIHIVNILLSLNADVNGKDNSGDPIIFYLVNNGLLEISNIFFNHPDFDVNIPNVNNETILEVSIVKTMTIHSKLILNRKPFDFRNREHTLKLMALSIERNNSVLAWKLYLNHHAYIIQKYIKKYMKKIKNNSFVTA